MTGTLLENFTQLMAAQTPAWASGPEAFVNDAHRSTFFVSRLITGSDRHAMIQSGTTIRDRIFLERSQTYQRYSPNPTFTPTLSQTGQEWSIPWSFATAWISWTKHELGLNKDTHTGAYRSTRFKSVMRQKHQNLHTEVMQGWDDELIVNTPDTTEMESASPTGPRIPYCIHALINEYDDPAVQNYATTATGNAPLVGGLQGAGLIPAEVDGGSTDWTTVQTIDPTASGRENWRPYQETYGTYYGTITDAADSIAATQLFMALSKAFWKTKIHQLPKKPEYSDKTTSPNFILCSIDGIAYYEQLLRVSQDEFRGAGKSSGQDPDYDGPTFRRVPFHVADGMSEAPVYLSTSGGNGVTELDTTADYYGPRFMGVNGEYLMPFCHSENYFAMDTPQRSVNQPFTHTQYMDMWNNFGTKSRRRHFHLRPNAAAV